MPKICTHCGSELSAAAIAVHVAKEFEREAPSGTYCIGVDKDCFPRDVERHRRLHCDAETVIGAE